MTTTGPVITATITERSPAEAPIWSRRGVLGLGAGVLLFGVLPGRARAADVTPAGRKLAAFLDGMDVEHHWPAGIVVDWRSGDPNGRAVRTEGKHTHCSAFVASAAERLGIYILRPPEHSPVLLANAQFDWLANDGAARGWSRLPDGPAAQAAANRGEFVVASYRNANPKKAGHIAIIRPSPKPDQAVLDEGPQVTQAGLSNYASTSLRTGFAGHGPALRDPARIAYWAHATP